jgi:hypothetical protein
MTCETSCDIAFGFSRALLVEGWREVWPYRRPIVLGWGGRKGWYARSDGLREVVIEPQGRRAFVYISPVRSADV